MSQKNKATRWAIPLLAIVLTCCGLQHRPAASAPEQPAVVKPPVKISYFRHEVKWPGETIGDIAYWYTGSSRNWRLVMAANPSTDHKKMRIGTIILIPETLLKTRSPMPETHISRPAVEKTRPITDSETPPLFAPIETNAKTDTSKTDVVYPSLETIEKDSTKTSAQ